MRICARSGCTQPAVVRVGMDAARLLVVLDEKVAEIGGYAVLCDRHVQTLTAPRGWWIADLRSDEPQLFRTPAAAPTPKDPASPKSGGGARRAPARDRARNAAATQDGPALVLLPSGDGSGDGGSPPEPGPSKRRRSRRQVAPPADAPGAGAVDAGSVPPAVEPAADPGPPEPSEPGVGGSIDDLLDAHSPLLARAFAASSAPPPPTGGVRSVIPTRPNRTAAAAS